MAYSDYGGYAFKNGVRVEERSDAVLSPEGIKSTPGQWPGWTLEEGRSGGSYHVLLGDGPIFIGMYKQSYLIIHRFGEKLNNLDFAVGVPVEAIEEYTHEGKTNRYIKTDYYKKSEKHCEFLVDGVKITVYWIDRDNHYQFVKMEQPDGNVWTGWSGYGVGAGLEDAGYGFSTEEQNERLSDFFPTAKAT